MWSQICISAIGILEENKVINKSQKMKFYIYEQFRNKKLHELCEITKKVNKN